MLGAVPELSPEEQEIKNRETPRTKAGSLKRDFMDASLSELGDVRGNVSRASAAREWSAPQEREGSAADVAKTVVVELDAQWPEKIPLEPPVSD